MSTRAFIDTGTDKPYVRRGAEEQFTKSDDVVKSLAQDVRQHANIKAPFGQGVRGDH